MIWTLRPGSWPKSSQSRRRLTGAIKSPQQSAEDRVKVPTKKTKPQVSDPTNIGENKPLTTMVKAATPRAGPRAIPKKKDGAKPEEK